MGGGVQAFIRSRRRATQFGGFSGFPSHSCTPGQNGAHQRARFFVEGKLYGLTGARNVWFFVCGWEGNPQLVVWIGVVDLDFNPWFLLRVNGQNLSWAPKWFQINRLQLAEKDNYAYTILERNPIIC